VRTPAGNTLAESASENAVTDLRLSRVVFGVVLALASTGSARPLEPARHDAPARRGADRITRVEQTRPSADARTRTGVGALDSWLGDRN
jgi:hypothetical protein